MYRAARRKESRKHMVTCCIYIPAATAYKREKKHHLGVAKPRNEANEVAISGSRIIKLNKLYLELPREMRDR